ncbi:unnamed protein product [Rotaria sp. Silwood1]|nr:unnamed protein product [Rotaria sp. Silwood1]CAF5043710.1 unnamed protein product [Rotaria sp. Silwood1]
MNKFTNPLNNIKVASPCSADWNEMIGDARKRFCGECKLNVYNLSEMSKMDAEQLLIQSEGRLCVRFYQRTDGTVITQDCPVGWQAVKQRVSKVSAAVVSLVIGLFGSLGFTLAYNKMTEPAYERTMGTVAYPTPKTSPTPKSNPTPPSVIMGGIPAPSPTPKNTPKKPNNDEVKMGKIALSRD